MFWWWWSQAPQPLLPQFKVRQWNWRPATSSQGARWFAIICLKQTNSHYWASPNCSQTWVFAPRIVRPAACLGSSPGQIGAGTQSPGAATPGLASRNSNPGIVGSLQGSIWAFVGLVPCSRVPRVKMFWHIPLLPEHFPCFVGPWARTKNPLLVLPWASQVFIVMEWLIDVIMWGG